MLLPDHVEAEVARFDDPGVDGADGHLMRVVARRPAPSSRRARRVRDQRPQRRVAGEVQSVEIVGLALVPRRAAGARSTMLGASAPGAAAASSRWPSGPAKSARDSAARAGRARAARGAPVRRVEGEEAAAGRQRALRSARCQSACRARQARRRSRQHSSQRRARVRSRAAPRSGGKRHQQHGRDDGQDGDAPAARQAAAARADGPDPSRSCTST